MLAAGAAAPRLSLTTLEGKAETIAPGAMTLAIFFEADCPTCQLALPYADRLAGIVAPRGGRVIGVSQDSAEAARAFAARLGAGFSIYRDRGLALSRAFDPPSVPAFFLIDATGAVVSADVGFSKERLNVLGARMCLALGIDPPVIAPDFDGAPAAKPGCGSRHLEPEIEEEGEEPALAEEEILFAKRGARASVVALAEGDDPYDACHRLGFADPLPVIPPTIARVEAMMRGCALPPDETVALVPPNYAAATVEKIAANAVMAGCEPAMMRVLIPLVRAACDERFNLHGVQATTHFAAPLVLVNGPVRNELGFVCGGNVMSNVARANSTLGRALQLILTNLGGARPGEIDMSTLGNPGKFSYCIAENEEKSPWEAFHIERGFAPGTSAVTLFAAEPPAGVSEHNSREGKQILFAISRALRNVWTYRSCMMAEAMVLICPEHAATLAKDGFTKALAREWLFEHTGVPVKDYENAAGAEGAQFAPMYAKATIDGEACYRKFREPGSLKIVVAGGTAGKFSAVIGSWVSGPRGSDLVTYPVV